MSNFTFQKNIKVDFTGTPYNTTSIFDISDNTGTYTTSSITYNQLTSTGPGLDFEVGVDSTYIEITCKSFTDACYEFTVTGSLPQLPNVITIPINFSSTQDFGFYGVRGITQVSEKNCRDIYMCGVQENEIVRLKNFSTDVYPNKGPFDFLTASYNQPYASDLLYLPQYDAIAYGNGQSAFASDPTKPMMSIVSMSGEILFESYPNSPSGSIASCGRFEGVMDDYLYVNGRVWDTGCTTVPPLPACIISDAFRVHLPTMTLDFDWINNVASNFPEPISQLIPLTGSNGYITVRNSIVYKHDVSGSIQWQLYCNAGAFQFAGRVAQVVQDSNDDLIIGGYFDKLELYSGSAPINIVGRVKTAEMVQYGITKTDINLDFRPFSSSFSRYTVNPFNFADTADRYSWFGPRSMGIDSNDNLVVGFVGSEPINTNISGSYVNVSGSLAVFDPTGSMIPNWNYPVDVREDFEGVKFIQISRIYMQEDDSFICLIDKSTSGNADIAEYDNLNVGPIMLVSQSGVLTDY